MGTGTAVVRFYTIPRLSCAGAQAQVHKLHLHPTPMFRSNASTMILIRAIVLLIAVCSIEASMLPTSRPRTPADFVDFIRAELVKPDGHWDTSTIAISGVAAAVRRIQEPLLRFFRSLHNCALPLYMTNSPITSAFRSKVLGRIRVSRCLRPTASRCCHWRRAARFFLLLLRVVHCAD